jgi:hypothetical protein
MGVRVGANSLPEPDWASTLDNPQPSETSANMIGKAKINIWEF